MAGGALEDFSRRPLQYKVLVFAGIGALLGLLYWQFMLSPLRKERDEALADLEGQKGEQDRLKAQRKLYDDLVKAESTLKADVEQNQKALPTEAEIPAFLDMLARKTSESGVEGLKRDVRASVLIQAVAPAATAPAPGAPPPPPPPGGAVAPAEFIKVPVEIEMTGTYYQLKKFFSSLRPRRADPNAPPPAPGQVQEKDRIVTVDSLVITDPKVKNNEIVLTARFVASTFRAKQTTPPPGATPPPVTPTPAPGATPGAAPGTSASSAPAVPGVAAKPDTMKAKTEDAMQKSEARTQKATESDGEKLPRDSTAPVPPGGN